MTKIVKFLKSLWVVFWSLTFTMLMWFPIGLAGFFGKKGTLAYKLCQIWVWVGKSIMFVRFEYEMSDKIDRSKSYVLMANHQSMIDIPALMLNSIPFRWMLKKELAYVPFFGWALLGARHIFIDRSRPKIAMKNMNAAVKNLPPGVGFAVFPEGTRNTTGELLPFKSGGFHSALSAGLDIVPITINGSHRILPDKKSFAFHPGKVQIIVHDPITIADYSKRNMKELIARTQETVASRLDPNYPL